MKNHPMRFTVLLAIGWIVVMLLGIWVNAGERLPLSDILVKVTDNSPPVTIPECTRQYTDAEYAVWARDENEASEKASYDAVRWVNEYLEGIRTYSGISGGSYMNGSSSRGDGGRRGGVGYGVGSNIQMYDSYSGSAYSVTMPFRYHNPAYVRPPVVIINPYCRPAYKQPPVNNERWWFNQSDTIESGK